MLALGGVGEGGLLKGVGVDIAVEGSLTPLGWRQTQVFLRLANPVAVPAPAIIMNRTICMKGE